MLNRWLGTSALLAVFLLKIVFAQGVSFSLTLLFQFWVLILYWDEQWYIGSYQYSRLAIV